MPKSCVPAAAASSEDGAHSLPSPRGWMFHSLQDPDSTATSDPIECNASALLADNDGSAPSPSTSPVLSELVQNFDDDGLLALSSLLTPRFAAGLREECMEIFDGVLGWLHTAGETEFDASYRKCHTEGPKYEYPLGVGLKHGYRELVMRSPGRYELALLVDDLPSHFETMADDDADYNGKWLLSTTLFNRATEKSQKSSVDEKSCLKQLLEWIRHDANSIGCNGNHKQQYPVDQRSIQRFMELVGAIFPPSGPADGSCNDSGDNNNAQPRKDEFYLCNFSLLVATPGCPTQSWHADGGHVSITKHERCHVFNVFVPLVDVPLSMGPTELRPGTHYHTRNLAPMMLVAKARKTLRPPVTPRMTMGDALVFDYRILHRGRANLSDEVMDSAAPSDAESDCQMEDAPSQESRGKDRPVLVLTFARRWFSDRVNFPKRSVFAT